MTLLTRHLVAGWYERTQGPKHVAEKWFAQPGATGTVLREEADTPEELAERLDLRESQLSNDQAIVTWPQGARVTDAEHSAAQILGTAPTPGAAIASNLAGSRNTPVFKSDGSNLNSVLADSTPVELDSQSASDAPLSDEERAKIAAEEAALEAAAQNPSASE